MVQTGVSLTVFIISGLQLNEPSQDEPSFLTDKILFLAQNKNIGCK